MSKIAVIAEDWPAVPGHGEEHKIYTVKVIAEFEHMIIGKKNWHSRKQMYVRDGMFVRVIEIKEPEA